MTIDRALVIRWHYTTERARVGYRAKLYYVPSFSSLGMDVGTVRALTPAGVDRAARRVIMRMFGEELIASGDVLQVAPPVDAEAFARVTSRPDRRPERAWRAAGATCSTPPECDHRCPAHH